MLKRIIASAALAAALLTGALPASAQTATSTAAKPTVSDMSYDHVRDELSIKIIGSKTMIVTLDSKKVALLCAAGELGIEADEPFTAFTISTEVEPGYATVLQPADGIPSAVKTALVCPIPEPANAFAAHVKQTWAMHRGHGNREFTDSDLRAVLTAIAKAPQGEIINRLDIPKGWWGNDLPYIKKAVEVGNSPTGQLIGYIVQGEVVKYYIVTDQCLEVCTGSAVIWHLHPPAKPKKLVRQQTPMATMPPANQGREGIPRMICTDCKRN